MFCRNCGKQLEDNVRFCLNCGTPVVRQAQAVERPPVQNTELAGEVQGTQVVNQPQAPQIPYVE